MAIWPFTRAKPAGWSAGQKLTAAEQNIVDTNAAQAADGLLWTDAIIAKNWIKSQTLTNATVVAYGQQTTGSTTRKQFRAFGTSDAAFTYRGGGDWSTDSTIAALPTTPRCAVVNGATVLVGGDNGSSAAKIARSTTGINGTYAAVNSVDTGTAVVHGLAYHSAASLYIAGLSDGGIETSPDGSTWTDRTVPNSDARKEIVSNGTIALAFTSATTDKYISSTDGVTWTERSLPASKAGWRGVYNSQLAKFYVISQGASPELYESSNGTSWSTVAHDLSIATGASLLISYRRVLVLFHETIIFYSVDGLAWHNGGVTGGVAASTSTAVIGDGRIVVLDTNALSMVSFGVT